MLRNLLLCVLPTILAALRTAPHIFGAAPLRPVGASAASHPPQLLRRAAAPSLLESGAGPGGGGMVDGMRIGPPPDMPSLLLNNRIVYLGMPINAAVTELILSELLFLQYESPEKPIVMYINSPGTTTEDGMPVGFETEAFAIADTMEYVEAPIRTVLVGKAYGLAAMLLACGERGKRQALPYGTVMLHQPRGQQAQGQASDIAIKAREVLLNRQMGLEIMSKACGVPMDKLAADTSRCLYMDAQGALEYGVIDSIVEKADSGIGAALEKSVSSISRGLG